MGNKLRSGHDPLDVYKVKKEKNAQFIHHTQECHRSDNESGQRDF